MVYVIYRDLRDDLKRCLDLCQNDFKKIKVIAISIGFCTLFTSVMVKILFELIIFLLINGFKTYFLMKILTFHQ